MTTPLAILAFFAITLGAIGTPAWPWFRSFLEDRTASLEMARFGEPQFWHLLGISTVIVVVGLGLGWWLYGNKSPSADEPDALEHTMPPVWAALRDKLYVDEFYDATVIAFYHWWAKRCRLARSPYLGRDCGRGCAGFRLVGAVESIPRHEHRGWQLSTRAAKNWPAVAGLLSRVQSGRIQTYLRLLALAVVVLAAILIWSSRG